MTRLRHSPRGYLRSMQMSNHRIFAFVEGKTDPYFYSRICESVCAPAGITFELRRAQELPAQAGGKQALLVFFGYMRRVALLLSDFKGKTWGAIFFVDKDVDDLMRTQKRSPHLVYTEYYDFENYIFKYGDLLNAMSAAASVNRLWLESQIGTVDTWRSSLAERWKEWVELCLFAKLKKVPGTVNYGVSVSPINIAINGPVDTTRYQQHLINLETASGLTNVQFVRSFRRISKLVEALYRSGEHDRIFKGKWYMALFEADIKTLAGTTPINSRGLANRLVYVLAATLDFDEGWADHFKDPIRDLISKL